MDLKLVDEDAEVLHGRASEWDFRAPPMDAADLVAAMRRVMKAHNGMGLAATQVGVPYRVFVADFEGVERVFFNPEVVARGGEEIKQFEGCLSFPGLRLPVVRCQRIVVAYADMDGVRVEESLLGLNARCVQHEVDHLDGICFTDRVSRLVLDIARRKREKFD